MINISNYIKESIFDNPEEIAKKDIKICPTSKNELEQIIVNEVQKYNYKKYDIKTPVDLNFIDTHEIKDMHNLFLFHNLNLYNYDISEWDVSNVEDMTNMFGYCSFFDCDLSKWNVGKVKNMKYIFADAKKFTGKGIENWNVSKVENMMGAFLRCNKLNCDLSEWNTENVNIFDAMFNGVEMKNVTGLENFSFKNCNYAIAMFEDSKNLTCDVSNWDLSKVMNMPFMFKRISNPNITGLKKIKPDKYADIKDMFKNTDIVLPSWYKTKQI